MKLWGHRRPPEAPPAAPALPAPAAGPAAAQAAPAAADLLEAPVTARQVFELFPLMLKRELENPSYAEELVARGTTLRALLTQLRECDELRARLAFEIAAREGAMTLAGVSFRCPRALEVTPWRPRRLLVVGSCLMEGWIDRIAALPDGCAADVYLFGAELPAAPARPAADYDAMLVQLPLRSVLPDGAFSRLAQLDLEGHKTLLEHATEAARHLLEPALAWTRRFGLATFVMPLLQPQQNPVGRLLPRHDPRNPVFLIEKINQAVARQAGSVANTYFLDLNEIFGTFGRRFIQEDMAAQFNHGSFMTDFDYDHDRARLDPPRKLTEVYPRRLDEMVAAVWREIVAMLRTLHQIDAVKLVVLDLDDTLWRGVAAEGETAEATTEGWPVALWEALEILHRRGMMLAIVSQNDEARVMAAWGRIMGTRLPQDRFIAMRIDWRPKPEKMAEVLAAANVLAASTVFIDDNPAQRAEMQAAFPDLRVLGGDPFTWRHILLWAPETQGARVTAESVSRTEMVRAQGAREAAREAAPRADFLAALEVRMTWRTVRDVNDARFGRVLELINRTNQFNTTGERWSFEGFAAAFEGGMVAETFEVADRYTGYGLVGILLVEGACIRQFVMSCRVLGLEVERAALARVVNDLQARGVQHVVARMIETERNLPCREVYPRAGFAWDGAVWTRATEEMAMPAHIALEAGT